MQVYDKSQRITSEIVRIIAILGVMMWIPWPITQSAFLTSMGVPPLHQEQELPVLTVCPAGPPTCQFAKIQQAIDAAAEPQSPYYEPTAEIWVAPGTYEENLKLIHKVVILKGAGKDRVFLYTPHKYQPVVLIVGAIGAAGALIEGFTIDGIVALAGGVAGAYIHGNRLRGSIFITGSVHSGQFEENEFQRNELCGISAIGVGRIRILRNTFQDGCAIMIDQARLYIPGIQPFQEAGDRVFIEGNQGGAISIWDGSAIAILKNAVYEITLRRVESALVEENKVRRGYWGIAVEGSTDVVVQKNSSEGNYYGIAVEGYPGRRTSVAILGNRVIGNDYGIVTESLEYITACQGNEVRENKQGNYVVGWPTNPQPSPELEEKCEGG